ncbi:hypothetical protein K432DRAFT_341911 [Lepidopterella palustris CBS 459.81]|uniref:Uncharacterized protein n=1 Tax=Lepidopterella palustris CBS 459.81 TaxID=1314670 RepID=A0A8E2ELP9_9PEZI|nr:hypothetical protein K432DRAFT_341911 [Lepidopterella palustris CBS 459.81]
MASPVSTPEAPPSPSASSSLTVFAQQISQYFKDTGNVVLHVVDFKRLSSDIQAKFGDSKEAVLAVDYKHLPMDVKDLIAENPFQTTFIIVNGVVFFAPGLLSGPLLCAFGWTSVGPRAGSLAAIIQSTCGTVLPRGLFATLQSASMGGYGAATVAWGVRVGAGIAEIGSWAWKGWNAKSQQDKRESEPGVEGAKGGGGEPKMIQDSVRDLTD